MCELQVDMDGLPPKTLMSIFCRSSSGRRPKKGPLGILNVPCILLKDGFGLIDRRGDGRNGKPWGFASSLGPNPKSFRARLRRHLRHFALTTVLRSLAQYVCVLVLKSRASAKHTAALRANFVAESTSWVERLQRGRSTSSAPGQTSYS